ncbi:hypothetical protein ACQUSY_09885 [Microbacterium sp. YY-03]|uniref:hypothetical protein n=1 Tax=Microbacterium sp. YY-03 TaxID=3421636 RepID=UPI003D170724
MSPAPTTITITGRRGWQPHKHTLTIALIPLLVGAAIIAVWLGAVTLSTGSPVATIFAVSALALLGVGIGILAAKVRAARPLVVRVAATADTVTFDAGVGARTLMRSLAPIGVIMLASLIALLFRGELYGDQGDAIFSGAGRFGSVVFFAVSILVIPPSLRAWRSASGASLTLSRDGVTLSGLRTGGSTTWANIGGTSFAAERATVLANTGSFSWGSRDLASDPVVLADLITHYAENPSARATIGSGTMALLQSGRF